MAAHTPGPWSFGPESLLSNDPFEGLEISPDHLERNGGSSICECWGDDKTANGRLIAAAPELLFELRHVLSAYVLPERKTCGEAKDDGERIKALIAKATGGTA